MRTILPIITLALLLAPAGPAQTAATDADGRIASSTVDFCGYGYWDHVSQVDMISDLKKRGFVPAAASVENELRLRSYTFPSDALVFQSETQPLIGVAVDMSGERQCLATATGLTGVFSKLNVPFDSNPRYEKLPEQRSNELRYCYAGWEIGEKDYLVQINWDQGDDTFVVTSSKQECGINFEEQQQRDPDCDMPLSSPYRPNNCS